MYVNAHTTADLHAKTLAALQSRVVAAIPAAGTWRDRLKTLLTDYLKILAGHPQIAQMAISTQPSGPNYLALAEAILALLGEGGVSDQAAAWGLDLLLLYPTAIAVEHSDHTRAEQKADEIAALATTIATADATRYRQIVPGGTMSAIHIVREYPYPLASVWRAVTDPRLIPAGPPPARAVAPKASPPR